MRPDRVEIYEARRGLLGRKQYRARVLAPNGKVLFVSAEGYNNYSDLLAISDRLFPNLLRSGVAPESAAESADDAWQDDNVQGQG